MTSQQEKANDFRSLHRKGKILVLPNAWDVSSARIFEQAGFPAVATTSGGIATSLGYQDGQNIQLDEMLSVVRRIARSLSIPVSADMEAGYGRSVEQVVETVRRAADAGAIGVNIEDSTGESSKPLTDAVSQVEKIRAIRKMASTIGIPMVVNARTDAFRFFNGTRDDRISETIRRGNLYLEAGADCIFAMFVSDSDSISQVVKGISGPVNIIAGLETPPISELEKLGVARVTFGSGPKRATLGLLKQIAAELLETGTYRSLTSGAITNAEMNKLAAPP